MKKADKGVVEKLAEVVGEGFSVERFVESFDVLAEAAGGIQALRVLIRDLATTGSLSGTGPNELPVSERIVRLEAVRRAHGVTEQVQPLEVAGLPGGWVALALSDLVIDFQNGSSKRHGDNGAPWPVLRLADIERGKLRQDSLREITLTDSELVKYGVLRGDILVIRVNGSADLVGTFIPCTVDRRWAYSDHLIRIRLPLVEVDPEYLCLFAATRRARRMLMERTITTAGQKTINQVGLGSLVVWLPPVEEQRVIAKRVGSLMGLCDELEARQSKKRELGARLTKSSLEALANAEGQGEVLSALTRILVNAGDVIGHVESVDALRSGIVDMASRGKLIASGHDDTQATRSLATRAAERRRLATARASRKSGAARTNTQWEDPYQAPHYELPAYLPALPKGWAYAPIAILGSDPLAAVQTGPFGQQLQAHEFVASGVPVIAVGNVTPDGLSTAGIYHITQSKARDLDRYDIRAGDLLFARSGATLGKVCVAPAYVDDWRMTGHILRLRLDQEIILPELAALWIRASSAVKRQIEETIRGGTRPGYNTSLLESIALPIPPLAEQRRIVAKVEHLLSLCDALEASLRRAEDRASRYAEAVVRELVA